MACWLPVASEAEINSELRWQKALTDVGVLLVLFFLRSFCVFGVLKVDS